MRLLVLLLLVSQVSCAAFKGETYQDRFKRMDVRITAYWKNSDKWTARGLTSTGAKLEHMKTCAVDPKVIPYGSVVKLETKPPLELTSIDTGGAVVSRKAAKKMGRDVPVVDVYFSTKRQAERFIDDNPYFVEAKIFN